MFKRLVLGFLIAASFVAATAVAFRFAHLAAYHAWTSGFTGIDVSRARRLSNMFLALSVTVVGLEITAIVLLVRRWRNRQDQHAFPVIVESEGEENCNVDKETPS